MSEGMFQLERSAGRGHAVLAIGTVSVTAQGTVTCYLSNFQVAQVSVVTASNVYEFPKITSTDTPSLIVNVTTSSGVSSSARTVHYLIYGNME